MSFVGRSWLDVFCCFPIDVISTSCRQVSQEYQDYFCGCLFFTLKKEKSLRRCLWEKPLWLQLFSCKIYPVSCHILSGCVHEGRGCGMSLRSAAKWNVWMRHRFWTSLLGVWCAVKLKRYRFRFCCFLSCDYSHIFFLLKQPGFCFLTSCWIIYLIALGPEHWIS